MPRSSVLREAKRRRKAPPRKKSESSAAPLSRKEVVGAVARNPVGHLLIEQALHESGFQGDIRSDAETLRAYSTDESIFEVKPQLVLCPKTPHDVEIAVQIIGKDSDRFPALSLTPRAAGTGLGGGSLTDSIVIDVCAYLTALADPVITKDGATIMCEPGAMWRDVEARLAPRGYYLPPYPASKDICSIGGAVANNSAGPDSFRYGQVADWVESLEVVLHDGNTYTVAPLSYKEYAKLAKEKHAYARIARKVFALIEANELAIKRAKPNTRKNTAGYALWDALDVSVKEFKRGVGSFDLTRLLCGSQGTLGIITRMTLRAEPILTDTKLIAVPVFNLKDAAAVVRVARAANPVNIEMFDDRTLDLALQNPGFFRARLEGMAFYKALVSLYATYHVLYKRKAPPLTFLITLDSRSLDHDRERDLLAKLQTAGGPLARLVRNPFEAKMLWQVRHASYLLSKLQDPNKRPAAFLEDMIVPPENLGAFLTEVKGLLKKYHVDSAVHGHGGDGHFHFYPLLDFTQKTTPALITKMSEEFFAVAVKHGGGLCGEHNDGIIRTPHLSKMFSKQVLELFRQTEHIFDPDDIFNPGKKVNPRFKIEENIRKRN